MKSRRSILLALLLNVVVAHAADKPNIVVILADDLGNADLGYRGSDIRTPNIDALAKGGVRLESFYGLPVCTPARAALMTGRYPMRYGLQTLVIFPSHTYGLPTDETHAAAGAEGGRLHDRDGRQVAPRPRRPEVLAAEPRLRPLLRQPRRRGRLLHASERGGIVDWQRNGKFLKEEGYYTDADRRRGGAH